MVEKINSKRALFPKGKQREFLEKTLEKISITEIAKTCGLSERTIRDWRREKFLMDFDALRKIGKATKTPLPQGIKLRDKYWYCLKGASLGGKAIWKKYGKIGDNDFRKKKWRKWWNSKGKYKQRKIFNIPKIIKKPDFSNDLSEFVGIMLGDGGLSKYQACVTLHSYDDKEYSKFVINLIEKLFNVPVRLFYRKEDSTLRLVISRINLVNFCNDIGLITGNKIKQQIDIPQWIKANSKFSISAIRGLFDTDGCVFRHSYKVNGKKYNYNKISFTSRSLPLINSVFKVLKKLGINSRITKSHWDVRIEAQKDVKKYLEIIGFNNPKNLKKIDN